MKTLTKNSLKCALTVLTALGICSSSARQSAFIKYRKDGEKINIYTTRTGVQLVNYRRNFTIIFPFKRFKSVFLTPWSRNPFKADLQPACEYEAIDDSVSHIFTTTGGFKFDEDKLGETPRIYITRLEQDLLYEGVKHYFGDDAKKIPPRIDRDPHRIWFFICITQAHHYNALHGL